MATVRFQLYIFNKQSIDLQEACDSIKSNVDNKDVDSLFYASVTADILKSKGKSTCQVRQP